MKKFSKCFFIYLFFTPPAHGEVAAPSAVVESLSVGQAVELALKDSPDVQQLQFQYESTAAKSRLALAPTEPTLGFVYNDLTQEFNSSTSASHSIVLTQPIGFPGRAFLNSSMYDRQAEALLMQMRAMRLQISVTVKAAYYNLQLAMRNLELNDDTRLAYERIMEITKRRYESGAAAQVDFLNAQVQLLSNQNDLADLQTAEKAARAQLNVYLHRPVDSPISVEPIKMRYYPKVDLEQALNTMIENRNELKAARLQVESSEKAYKLAWMQLVPDFQLSAGINTYDDRYASPYSGDTVRYTNNWPTETYSVGLQITIPLWGLFNEREVIRGAARDRGAAQRAVDVLYNQSRMAMESAVDTMSSTVQKIENFERHILPLSEQSLKLAINDYGTGKTDFATLSATAAARRQARLSYAQAVVTYLTTYATYGQLIGEDLDEAQKLH